MKNALNSQVGMLGDMFLWLVANLKQGVIYFIKQALPPNITAGSVHSTKRNHYWGHFGDRDDSTIRSFFFDEMRL